MRAVFFWVGAFLALAPAVAPGAIKVERREGGWESPSYTITTGPMRFAVRLDGDGYLGRVWLDGDRDGKFENFEVVSNPRAHPALYLRYVRTGTAADYPPGMWRINGPEIPLWGHADSIWVTEGEGEVTVHAQGRFGYDDSWPYRLELRAREGDTAVHAAFKFVYRGNPGTDFITALGVATGFDYAGRESFVLRRYAFGGEDRVRQTIVNEARWCDVAESHRRQTPARWFGSASKELRSRIYEYGLSLKLEEWDVPMPEWNLASMIQFTPGYYKIWKAIKEDVGCLPVHFGRRCQGWVDVSDKTRGMAVIMRRMAESAPKALSVNTGDWDSGGVVLLELWPDQVPPLDLRPAGGDDFSLDAPGVRERLHDSGIQATYEWLVYFHSGDYREGGVEERAAAFQVRGSGKGGGGR